ncbi:MAG: trypsin-like peptidase domain-containing protein [Planctomycetes bacterium]|nr:trypsin-like peptidase domain-containing protein [Planctomycetota bacterium]
MTRSAFLAAAMAVATTFSAQGQTPSSAPTDVAPERLAEIFAGDDPKTVAELEAMQRHVQQLIRRVLPATVSLPGASGVLVERDGAPFLLCAAHVTLTADKQIDIRLDSGKRLVGTSLGANHRSDVSLVRVDTEGEHSSVEIGRSAELQRGQWVLMLGHPSGRKPGRSAPARLGRVLRVREDDYLVTDCTMQGGDSGGPLFDMQGRVVGINSRISGNLAMNMHAPIDALVGEWQELQQGKVTEARRRGGRGRLGFGVPLTYGEGCPVFGEVPKDGDAAKAGLQAGDRLFEIDGAEVESRRDVLRILREFRRGDRVQVVVERDGKGVELELPLVQGGGR